MVKKTITVNPEFGCELALAIPYAYWLHQHDKLERVVTSIGMKPFYYFCDDIEEKFSFRTVDNAAGGLNQLPNNSPKYIDENCTLEEATKKIKQNTRRFAKRQITWFKKDISTKYFSPNSLDEIIKFIG